MVTDLLDQPVPSQRGPRRTDTLTYRVRVDLRDATPPLWRRLELSSDLFLDELHDVLQAAFGWTDSHLHEFRSGADYYGLDVERYLCPFMVEEDDGGVPEERVRLDELLTDPGDHLSYCYDFGDDWLHVFVLEEVLPRIAETPRAVCTAGRRPGPPEDCGGIHGYELVAAASDVAHPDHVEALRTFREWYGDGVLDHFRPTPFDIDEINSVLTEFGSGDGEPRPDGDVGAVLEVSPALAALWARMPASTARRKLLTLIGRAELDRPVQIDAAWIEDAVRPYRCLLGHVGADGVALTQAGYLPPRVVSAVFTELGMDEHWIGKGNREDLTPQVLDLRESAQKLGLIRKHRGRLHVTKKGQALRDDPVALWRHVATKTPGLARGTFEREAGLFYLCAIAGGAVVPAEVAAQSLTALGWTCGGDIRCTAADALTGTRHVRYMLDRLGLMRRANRLEQYAEPTDGARLFAKVALLG